jgi:hypothetical protein
MKQTAKGLATAHQRATDGQYYTMTRAINQHKQPPKGKCRAELQFNLGKRLSNMGLSAPIVAATQTKNQRPCAILAPLRLDTCRST